MTNSNLFYKIQNFPKNTKFSKKAKKFQKSQNLPKNTNFGFFLAFLAFFGFFWLFWKILDYM
jgi:hypothetical protein